MNGRTEAARLAAEHEANEPVAWIAWFHDENRPDADFLFSTRERADGWCRTRGAEPAPLYSRPQPMLTDAEREALEAAARIIDAYEEEMDGFPSGAAATLRGLLERLA